MVRMPRAEVFAPEEVNIAHVCARVVRRCFLMGDDPISGKNFDHRKDWIEAHLQRFAASFGIDLLGFAILSNHFHLILRSRPDVVETWDDTEVARRWLRLCPQRRNKDGTPAEPSRSELDQIRCSSDRLAEIRRRLSDISWWMRLLCQRVAMRANREDEESGRFWQDRFKAVRLLDEASLLACAAYVDLNPIRAALNEKLEDSDHTSAQRRIEQLELDRAEARGDSGTPSPADTCSESAPPVSPIRLRGDAFLSPLTIDESNDPVGPCPSASPHRCSDKGIFSMSLSDYLQLLDWTARQIRPGKRGATPADTPSVIHRLGLEPTAWTELVSDFGRLFSSVAGLPSIVDLTRSNRTHRRFRLKRRVRELLATAA